MGGGCAILQAWERRGRRAEGSKMVRRAVGALAIATTLILLAAQAAQQKDKDTTELTAKVVKTDVEKGILTVADMGKNREFTVTEQTKIVGPKGFDSKERLKDERFAAGWELKLTIAADGKKLVQIQLPLRKEKKSDKE
jgi:hypothetical protein